MSTFTTTGPLVRFTDTDGDVSFVASSPRVTFTAAYQSVTGGGGGGATDLDDLTDVTITAAAAGDILRHNGTAFVDVPGTDYYRDVYAPALVMSPAAVTAFGGSMVNGVSLTIAALSGLVPAGFDVLIWNGTAGAAPNGSYTSDGAGNFTYSSRQYLNATSFGNGCQIVTGPDQVTSGSTGGPSVWKIVTANGTDYGLSAVGGYAFEASLNLSLYVTDAEITGLEALTDAASFALAADPAAWMAHNGETNGAFTFDAPGDLVDGIDIRATFRLDQRNGGGDEFWEILTQTHDSGLGAWDNFELAIRWGDGDVARTLDKPYLYWEWTKEGGVAEIGRYTADAGIIPGAWCSVRLTQDFATGVITFWREVAYGGDDVTTDGREWRSLYTVTTTDAQSFDSGVTEDWAIGYRSNSQTAALQVRDGVDGTLVVNVTDTTMAAASNGATTFTDTESNVLASTGGTVVHSLDARVDTLEAAPSTVDVVSNVATSRILGRTSSGSGDSEELTVADVRTLLAQNSVLLHSETVASDAASKSYDVTGWDKIRVEFMGRSTRNGTTDSLLMTLNANTGSVYSTNAAALTTALTLGTVAGINTNTDRLGLIEAELALMSGWLKAGYSRGTNLASTAAVGAAVVHNGLFSTITAAVTTVELKMSLANIVAGSRIRIIGLQ